MSLTTSDILLKHVCPGLGCGIAFIMFASPLKVFNLFLVSMIHDNISSGLARSVLFCLHVLHELNALPFIAMAANCFSWIIYGFVTSDFYIYVSNMPGLCFGMFYVLVCYKFSMEQAQDMLRNIFLGFCGLFWIVGLASLAATLDTASTKTLWGSVCVSVLALYYTAPLSSVARVVAKRDSSSLYWPLCSMNIINGMLWFAYGMALKDYFVGLPNGIGAAFNVICLALCFIFPAKDQSNTQSNSRTCRCLNICGRNKSRCAQHHGVLISDLSEVDVEAPDSRVDTGSPDCKVESLIAVDATADSTRSKPGNGSSTGSSIEGDQAMLHVKDVEQGNM